MKAVKPKFPLRLMPSVRQSAETYSQKEGVSLNQFINVAVAEKLASLHYEEWLHDRQPPTRKSVAAALRILDKPGGMPPQPGDELPAGYKRDEVASGGKLKRRA